MDECGRIWTYIFSILWLSLLAYVAFTLSLFSFERSVRAKALRIAQLSEHVDRGKDRLAGIILGGSRDQSVKLHTSQLWNSHGCPAR